MPEKIFVDKENRQVVDITMGRQPRGYTVWVNVMGECLIRINGLTDEQAHQLRSGNLDITADAKKLAVDKIMAFLVELGDHAEIGTIDVVEFMDTIRPGFLKKYNEKTME